MAGHTQLLGQLCRYCPPSSGRLLLPSCCFREGHLHARDDSSLPLSPLFPPFLSLSHPLSPRHSRIRSAGSRAVHRVQEAHPSLATRPYSRAPAARPPPAGRQPPLLAAAGEGGRQAPILPIYFAGGSQSPGPSDRRRCISLVARAKFQTFDRPEANDAAADDSLAAASAPSTEASEVRADECLPGDLGSAIRQASTAAAAFCNAGGTRAIVELLVPDMEVLAEDGSQQRIWDSSRSFLDALKGQVSCENVRAIFPDSGTAAMVKYQWGLDAPFAISSLNDRRPVREEDELVVLVCPDYQMLEKVESIAGSLAAEDGLTRPMIMWNPRLSSGDVGIGLNVRRMRNVFLRSFTSVYHLRPLGVGAIFRCYPEPWHLFLDDPETPGRYVLYRRQGSKPTGDDVEEMYLAASGKLAQDEASEPSILDQLASTFSSMSRFMNSLTK